MFPPVAFQGQIASPLALTRVGNFASNSTNNNYNFNIALGVPTYDRLVIITVGGSRNSGTPSLNSISVAGVNFSKVVESVNSVMGISMSIGVLPAGTSGVLSVAFNATMQSIGGNVCIMNGYRSFTPSHSGTADSGALVTGLSMSQSKLSGGVALFGVTAAGFSGGGGISFSGWDNNAVAVDNFQTTSNAFGGAIIAPDSGTGVSQSIAFGSSARAAMCGLSFI